MYDSSYERLVSFDWPMVPRASVLFSHEVVIPELVLIPSSPWKLLQSKRSHTQGMRCESNI